MSAYRRLEDRFKRITLLEEAAGVLHWDMSTMMPPGGAFARGEQLATLSVLAHELMTDPAVGEWLAAAGDDDPVVENKVAENKVADDQLAGDWQRANLREMHRQWMHATAVPAALVEALSKATSACETVWRKARADSDFAAAKPSLQTVLDLVREAAAAKAAALGVASYDALLDQYDPGLTCARIDAIFDDLATELPDLLAAVQERQAGRPAPVLPDGQFPVAAQRRLVRAMSRAVGFDFDSGRLDESLHPFSGGVPADSRITTRYDEADFTQALLAVLHETGHAMYERGRPAAWRYQPVGTARGMTLHESQSLLIEMQACRSRHFVEFLAPQASQAFDGTGPAWQPDNLLRLLTRVQPDYIRVDADEVTYPAHIILRYRLERALLAGELSLDDLPAAWNDGMQDLLGIRPPDDRRGCLQDIHWYDGAWGYFPTYTLGAMAAAQIFAAARAHQLLDHHVRRIERRCEATHASGELGRGHPDDFVGASGDAQRLTDRVRDSSRRDTLRSGRRSPQARSSPASAWRPIRSPCPSARRDCPAARPPSVAPSDRESSTRWCHGPCRPRSTRGRHPASGGSSRVAGWP